MFFLQSLQQYYELGNVVFNSLNLKESNFLNVTQLLSGRVVEPRFGDFRNSTLHDYTLMPIWLVLISLCFLAYC